MRLEHLVYGIIIFGLMITMEVGVLLDFDSQYNLNIADGRLNSLKSADSPIYSDIANQKDKLNPGDTSTQTQDSLAVRAYNTVNTISNSLNVTETIASETRQGYGAFIPSYIFQAISAILAIFVIFSIAYFIWGVVFQR